MVTEKQPRKKNQFRGFTPRLWKIEPPTPFSFYKDSLFPNSGLRENGRGNEKGGFRKRHLPKVSGFTLIELLIAMALTVALAVIGFINLTGYRQNQDLGNAAKEIVAILRDAQNRSISGESTSSAPASTGVSWGVYFDNTVPANSYYDLYWAKSPLTNYNSAKVLSRTVLPSRIQFDTPLAGSPLQVYFQPLTGSPLLSSTIRISVKGSSAISATITVDANGRIQY